MTTELPTGSGQRIRQTIFQERWPLLSLLAAIALLYWPVLSYEFLNWDDSWYVTNNPRLDSWSPQNLWAILTEVSNKNYAPLTTFSLLIDRTLFGDWAGGFHLTNVLLHAMNAGLVYFLIKQLTGRRSVALLTALLFAVHPVQLESVAWISSRKGLLSSAFILASLLYWTKPRRTEQNDVYGLLFFALALLAKAIAIMVPPVVVAYDVLVRKESLRAAMVRQSIPAFLAALLLLLTMSAQNTVFGGLRGHFSLSKLEILAVDLVILWRYVGILIYPANLCVLYDPATSGIAPAVIASALGWGVVAGVCWRTRKTFPLAVWGVLTFFAFLFPVLNFFPITTLMNDRYLYLPAIPLFALAAWGLESLATLLAARLGTFLAIRVRTLHNSPLARHAMISLCGASLIALYGVCAAMHLPTWQNSRNLWEHAANHVGHLAVVRYQLADSYYKEGDVDGAIAILQRCLDTVACDEGDQERIERRIRIWNESRGEN